MLRSQTPGAGAQIQGDGPVYVADAFGEVAVAGVGDSDRDGVKEEEGEKHPRLLPSWDLRVKRRRRRRRPLDAS
jgi:hypothetical protein